MNLFEVLGILGIAISLLAYVPQVIHLVREHCSDGVSGRAWAMWLTSGLLIGALALHRRDPVFIMLQASSLTSTAVILFLSHRYRGMVCEGHAHSAPSRTAATLPTLAPDDVERLKQAAVPLIMSLREDQKREVRTLAHVMGLEQIAAQF